MFDGKLFHFKKRVEGLLPGASLNFVCASDFRKYGAPGKIESQINDHNF